MFEKFKHILKVNKIKNKFLIILFIIFIFKLGSYIPIPYINLVMINNFFNKNYNTVVGFFNLFTGGGLSQGSIFAMSITPYINASIILQLIIFSIPNLEKNFRENGEVGKKKLLLFTKYLSIFISFIQASSYYFLMKSQKLLLNNNILSGIIIIIILMLGTMILLWLSEFLSNINIGNGISIILFISILSRFRNFLYYILKIISENKINIIYILINLIILICLIMLIIFIDKSEQQIEIKFTKCIAENFYTENIYNDQALIHLPIKINSSGVMPIIFASSILSLPTTLSIFYRPKQGTFIFWVTHIFTQINILYIIIFILLIILFNYFYITIQYNPIEIINYLKQNNGFINGINSNKETIKYITRSLSVITFISTCFLIFVSVIPYILTLISGNIKFFSIGGTSLIIIVGVALEIVKQVEAQMTLNCHKGFLE